MAAPFGTRGRNGSPYLRRCGRGRQPTTSRPARETARRRSRRVPQRRGSGAHASAEWCDRGAPWTLHRRSIARWKRLCGCGILARAVTHVSLRILGRLEALVGGRRVDLPSRRERALLGVLLLHAGEVVSVEALIDSVWGEAAPASARHMVHEYVSRLRSELGDASVIATRSPGYVVERG